MGSRQVGVVVVVAADDVETWCGCGVFMDSLAREGQGGTYQCRQIYMKPVCCFHAATFTTPNKEERVVLHVVVLARDVQSSNVRSKHSLFRGLDEVGVLWVWASVLGWNCVIYCYIGSISGQPRLESLPCHIHHSLLSRRNDCIWLLSVGLTYLNWLFETRFWAWLCHPQT